MPYLTRRLAGWPVGPVRLTALCTVALLSAATLTACGGNQGGAGGKQGDVATLSSSGPAKPTASADAGRPQFRLDMTEDEKNQIWTTYKICLKEHGVKPRRPDQPGPDGDGPGKDLLLDDSGEPKSAYLACANKLPLRPPELDPAKNPDFPQQWNDLVKCLRGRGMQVHVTVPGEWTWDDDRAPVPDGPVEVKIEHECEMEVFGGKKK
jgi:hypothetical protein